MPSKKKTSPERIGLSLHKHLTPHVAEKSAVLAMNPNEFVNTGVEQCIEAMISQRDPGPGAPSLVALYREQTGKGEKTQSGKLTETNYALLRALDEAIYDLRYARESLISGLPLNPVMTPAVIELLQQFLMLRARLIGTSDLAGKPYHAPRTET